MKVGQPRLWRSRWAAIGAAVAVTLGAGGLATTFASSPPSSLVAISPVRVLDTRLGGMGGSLTSAVPRLLDVTGSISTVAADAQTVVPGTVVPDGATAIVANVTIVGPTTPGFVAVRPGTASGTPTTSSLNAAAAGVIVPNSVAVEVPTTGPTAGQIQLWFQGTSANAATDLLVDIVGYYQAGASGPAGPQGPTGPAGPSGLAYVGTFRSEVSTGIGVGPPAAPTNYTATFDLTPGRYFVTGDLSVRSTDLTNPGLATCELYVGETTVGSPSAAQVAPGAFENFAISNNFTVTTGGPTTVSFRCDRTAANGMFYQYLNLTLFRVT